MRDISIHTPVPALWKDKKEQSHDGGTWICDVIVMLKGRHHVTSQRIQDFQVVFFFNINEVFSGEQEKESIFRMRIG